MINPIRNLGNWFFLKTIRMILFFVHYESGSSELSCEISHNKYSAIWNLEGCLDIGSDGKYHISNNINQCSPQTRNLPEPIKFYLGQTVYSAIQFPPTSCLLISITPLGKNITVIRSADRAGPSIGRCIIIVRRSTILFPNIFR